MMHAFIHKVKGNEIKVSGPLGGYSTTEEP